MQRGQIAQVARVGEVLNAAMLRKGSSRADGLGATRNGLAYVPTRQRAEEQGKAKGGLRRRQLIEASEQAGSALRSPDRRLIGPLTNATRSAVLLCYHSINDSGPEWLSVTPERFEQHLHALRRAGYVSSTDAALNRCISARRLERPHVFLTFDDGYVDNFVNALPLLREYKFTATVFVLPPYLDEGRSLDWPEVRPRLREHPEVMRSMTWSMVDAMADAGVRFGSHGLAHTHLPELSNEELMQELSDSRQRLTERLGSCDSFAYPFGEWSARVASAVAAAGYSFAFTLPYNYQRAATRMSIPRVSVDHRDSSVRFGCKLQPAVRRLLLSPTKQRIRWLRARGTKNTTASTRDRETGGPVFL